MLNIKIVTNVNYGQELKDGEDDLVMGEDLVTGKGNQMGKATSPPPLSEDESDIESLHSFHYSPKAVDIPSAIRLAKRLYSLDGFKKSDVSRHLSKKYNYLFLYVYNLIKIYNFLAMILVEL